MIKFASRSTTMQLAVAAAVLMPMSAFAETPMTARQMLAHAQTQALNVPGDIKKPALEPDRSEKFSGEAIAAPTIGTALAAPLPLIEPPAPIAPPAAALTALATPVAAPEPASPQSRSNALTAVTPAADAVKASNAQVAIPPVTAGIAAAPAATPSTPMAVVASPAAAPAQPTLPAATATETTQMQAVTTTSSTEKPVHAQRQPAAATPAPARPARKSVARSSGRSDDAAINTQISRIMRRPEVQSLMSQYGLD